MNIIKQERKKKNSQENEKLKINFLSVKINKIIEIVIVPKKSSKNFIYKNVAIDLDEKLILKILSSRYENVFITIISSENDLKELSIRKPDLVFSGVKYFNFNNKKIWLNDFLEDFGIKYIVSNSSALQNESDKNKAKKIMQKTKVKTADFFLSFPGKHPSESSLPLKFPLFIKPSTGGNSLGVDFNSIVYNYASFKAKVLDIKLNQNLPSLVETYLSGKEYSVGIFEDNTSGNLIAMPIEIIVKKNINGHCILDFNVKKNDQEKVIEVLDMIIFDKLVKLAKKSFKALGGKSIGRIDIKMNQSGIPHFIEANLMPGLEKGYFYRSCLINFQMSYEDMIFNIASIGLTSH